MKERIIFTTKSAAFDLTVSNASDKDRAILSQSLSCGRIVGLDVRHSVPNILEDVARLEEIFDLRGGFLGCITFEGSLRFGFVDW